VHGCPSRKRTGSEPLVTETDEKIFMGELALAKKNG
jgi:hypothetical protein